MLLLNFNNHLWVDEDDCRALTEELEKGFVQNELGRNNIYIGGMSIGGNVALRPSNYLMGTTSDLAPKGLFIVDSPIDL